jgi:hypothetical protein
MNPPPPGDIKPPSAPPESVVPPPLSSAAETVGGASPPQVADTSSATGQGKNTADTVHAPVSTESIRGAANVFGSQINHIYGPDGQARVASQSWEDELVAVSRLPEPGHALASEEVERRADALQSSRLLLVRHGASRQQEAEAAMRAVLHALQRREPGRLPFFSGFDGTVHPAKLRSAAEWRADRRGILIYLYRSADSATLDFFNNIEQVDALCHKLTQMDCYLILTASGAGRTALRDEAQLGQRIGLWSFDPEHRDASSELAALFNGKFEATLACCAALFPGLPAGEFATLVKLLATPAAHAGTAQDAASDSGATPSSRPPTRQERWWQGERDVILAELGLRLQMPPQAQEAEYEAADAGIFFEEAARRSEMPSWLYDKHPFLLCEHLETLTVYYLKPESSRRFGVGYRRLVQQLHAIGAHPLQARWLIGHAHAALGGNAPQVAMHRIADLLAALPEDANRTRLIEDFLADVASMAVTEEEGLLAQLQLHGLLDAAAAIGKAPYASHFWQWLHGEQDARPAIEQAAQRQMIIIDLLMALAAYAPAAVARTLGNTLNECNARHRGWLQAADVPRRRQPVLSMARQMFREHQAQVLRQDAAQWVALAAAVGLAYPPPAPAPRGRAEPAGNASDPDQVTGRWLAWDCLHGFASLLDDFPDTRWPDAVYAGLLSGDAAQRTGLALAPLIRSTAPPPWHAGAPANQGAELVDTESMLWLYQLLALAAMLYEPGDPARAEQVATALIAPLRGTLPPQRRIELADQAAAMLQQENEARANASDRSARDMCAGRVRALQLVVRLLRTHAPQPSPTLSAGEAAP